MGYIEACIRTLIGLMKDKAAYGIIVSGTIFYSFFYPTPYHQQHVVDLPIGVVDSDNSALSRALIRKLNATHAVFVHRIFADMHAAEDALQRNEIDGILLIPYGVERDLLKGETPSLAVFGNAAYLLRNASIQQSAIEVITQLAADTALLRAESGLSSMPPAVKLVQRPLFNTREGYASYMLSAIATLIVHQTLMIGIALMLAGMYEEMPNVRFGIRGLFGVTTMFTIFGWLMGSYFYGFSFWYHDYPRMANWTGGMLGLLLTIISFVFFALFIGSFFKRREYSFQILMPISTPIFFLSGVSWPDLSIPIVLVWLSKLLPVIPGMSVMIKFNQMGSSFQEAAPELINLLLLLLLYGFLAWYRLCKPKKQQIIKEPK